MRCGYVVPTMQVIENWMPKIDQSLIRYFIVQVCFCCACCDLSHQGKANQISLFEVLEMVTPPYSNAFVKSLMRIVGAPAITDALKGVDCRELIRDFISHCSCM